MALAGGAAGAPQTDEGGAAPSSPQPGVFDELSNALASVRAAVSWLARRRKRAANVPASGVATAAKTSALGVALAFIVRYGKPALPFILRQVQAAQRQRAA